MGLLSELTNRIRPSPEKENHQLNLFFRLKQNLAAPGIRGKVIGIVLGVTVLLTLISVVYIHIFLKAALDELLDQKTTSVTRYVAARSVEPIITNNIFKLHQLAYDTLENDADIAYVLYIDHDGKVLVHTFKEYFPPDLLNIEHNTGDNEYSLLKFQAEEGVLRDIAVPVFPGLEQEIIVRVGVIDYSLQDILATATRELLIIAALTFISLGTLAFIITTFTTIKPLTSLLHSVEAVGRGDLTQQFTINTKDELSTLAEAFKTMTRQLALAQQARNRLIKKIVYSQEEERQRISRELHDETGQMLSTMMISLRLLENSNSLSEVKQQTANFRQLLLQSLEQVRQLAWRLTPTPLINFGLKTAMESLIKKYQDSEGLSINLQIKGLDTHRHPLEIEATVYRVVQEALTNIARHAQAKNVNIFLDCHKDKMLLAIEDDGVGFKLEKIKEDNEQKTSLGLITMEERISLIGGQLKIESAPGKGTAYYIYIPLPL